MSNVRRKWVSGHPGWRVQWIDSANFKIEHESDNLTDGAMEEWGSWMDTQIERRFGHSHPRLTATTLNFSRNDLGDRGIHCIMEYLRRRRINVQVLKFFKNSVGDMGAHAIAQFVLHSPQPVQELHLSHNRIADQGAQAIFEAVGCSGRYPCASDRMRRDHQGNTPIWLRMEYNLINWSVLECRLRQHRVRWCSSESRDGWVPREHAPMVCVHVSYQNQKPLEQNNRDNSQPPRAQSEVNLPMQANISQEAFLDGQHILAALQGGVVERHISEYQPEQADLPQFEIDSGLAEEVPLYVFLDAFAVQQMAFEDGAFLSFRSLLSLCEQGHMQCVAPPELPPLPVWACKLEERERVIFVVTDLILDDLDDMAEQIPDERRRLEWFLRSPDSYLHLCRTRGILEVLGTDRNMQLMKVQPSHEQTARELHVSRRSVRMLDFAVRWEAETQVDSRVLVVTGNEATGRLFREVAEDCGRRVLVFTLNDMEAHLKADWRGSRLRETAAKAKAFRSCGASLSASLLLDVLQQDGMGEEHSGHDNPPKARRSREMSGSQSLRKELREAMALMNEARPHLSRQYGAEGVLGKIDEAQRRWQRLLAQR